ncbi:MAG: polyprenyl synthetase family protein [Lachnospiraceae bacterium]|nr:polyprenyl synthetase family protein [Lachnospiraceae bacterium]
MNDLTFQEVLKEKTAQITDRIRMLLPKEEGRQRILFEAMNYSVLAGGKRVRPMLMQETYRCLGGAREREEDILVPFMGAIEMIHSYSLVQDELPAMDNDMYRRGKLTTHAAYGHAMGILAGDGLLNLAFETALAANGQGNEGKLLQKALRVLAGKSGARGMVGGQTVDVIGTGKSFTEEELLFIYKLKTGALLEASMMAGAILAGADDETVCSMEEVAADVGLAFQIQDDVLDVTSTVEELGKAVFSDEKNKKTTYVSLFGIEAAKKMVEKLTDRALAKLGLYVGENEDGEFLKALLLSLVKRTK